MIKILPKLLLFLCAVALLLGLGLYAIGMKHTTNRTEITFMVKADSTGMVTPETRAMADSIVGVLTKDEKLLADKYQYVIDQQAKTQDFLAIGGILLGIIAIIILLWIVNLLLIDMMEGTSFVYDVPVAAILISIAISAVTIFLSCLIPAIKASRISPIEAIRGNADIKIKAKKVKTLKLTKKLFGIGGVIASKNLKRNKKKYRTTVISLVVSI